MSYLFIYQGPKPTFGQKGEPSLRTTPSVRSQPKRQREIQCEMQDIVAIACRWTGMLRWMSVSETKVLSETQENMSPTGNCNKLASETVEDSKTSKTLGLQRISHQCYWHWQTLDCVPLAEPLKLNCWTQLKTTNCTIRLVWFEEMVQWCTTTLII